MSSVLLRASILGTGTVLPGRRYSTREVLATVGQEERTESVERATGIRTRYWVPEGTLVAPIAAEALRLALDKAGLAASDLQRIILVHSGGIDSTFPATANKVAASLGLNGSCDAFDLCNACMGFLTGLDVAARFVVTGGGPVGVVSGELTSRGIRPSDLRPYLVFGDAAAAAIIGPSRGDEGILATFLANDGSLPPDVFGHHPTLTSKREYIQFVRSAGEIFDIAFAGMKKGVEGVLARAGVALHEIEWLVPHQPNGAMLDAIIKGLGVDPARVVRVVDEIGSVASASIPSGLDRLLRTRPVKAGDRILMFGVGGGVSYGGTLYRVGGA
jgi:3-oxoacyl-(acyl-carrier-protein) synthase III